MFQSFQTFPSACSGPEFIEGKPFKSLTEEESEPEAAGRHVLSLVEKMQRAQNKFHEHFRA
jgi:hypothetical protein